MRFTPLEPGNFEAGGATWDIVGGASPDQLGGRKKGDKPESETKMGHK